MICKNRYGFAFSKTGNYHDASDLSQDIMLQLCKSWVNFSKMDNTETYIY
ncbi:MAG: sigma-70 family RNA polymerase sigma factor [Clostridiales bacterium]|nr:sigma-70 family RNA polymerase sigma factor [Clostridiales bacterium]